MVDSSHKMPAHAKYIRISNIVTKLARVPLKLARVSLKLTMVNLRGIGAVLGIGVMACVFLVTFDNHWMISVPNALTGNSAQLFKLHQGKY